MVTQFAHQSRLIQQIYSYMSVASMLPTTGAVLPFSISAPLEVCTAKVDLCVGGSKDRGSLAVHRQRPVALVDFITPAQQVLKFCFEAGQVVEPQPGSQPGE